MHNDSVWCHPLTQIGAIRFWRYGVQPMWRKAPKKMLFLPSQRLALRMSNTNSLLQTVKCPQFPKRWIYILIFVPGHLPGLQVWDSWRLGQGRPCCSCSWVTLLLLLEIPSPQLAEHWLHKLHSLARQSTGESSEKGKEEVKPCFK